MPTSQRSGPLKANQGIDTMTRSPHHRETPTDHWADTKGASHRGSLTPKRSSSMTNLRGTSPELWSGESSARSSQHSGLMDTSSIRQAVFDEWKSRKSAKLKEQVASKSAEKKKQEEKEQEERERKKMVNTCNNNQCLQLYIHVWIYGVANGFSKSTGLPGPFCRSDWVPQATNF